MVAPPAHPPTAGLILAGGLSRRMGGVEKPLLDLGGRTLLDRVAARIAAQTGLVLLNVNGDGARHAGTGLTIVPDDVAGFAGPLAGVLAGLDWLASHRPDIAWMASVAADTPFLPIDLVSRLHLARAAGGVPLACGRSRGRAHPVNALWPVDLRHDLRSAVVEEGERRIDAWTSRHGIVHVDWDGPTPDPFFNVNRPEDLAEAERLLTCEAVPP